MSLPLILTLLAQLPGSLTPSGPQARVEVLEGRAVLAGRGVIARMDEVMPPRWIAGPAHLELAPGSRARVSWSGQASLLLEGRTVLEWTPPDQAGGVLDWNFAEVSRAHLELRRGPVDVHLAQNWSGRFQSGACYLGGISGGNVELIHTAGLPIDLWPPERDGRPSAPFTVLAGGQVRLMTGTSRPLALSGSGDRLREPHQRLGGERWERGADHPAWRSFSWPWLGERASVVEATSGNDPALPDLPSVMAEPGAEGARSQAAQEPRRVPDSRLPADSAPGAVQAGPGETSGGVRGPGTPGTPAGGARPVQEPADAGGPVSDGGLPQASKDGGPPTARPASGLRETGILILTPYGPRWVEQALPVDPALRSTEPVKPSASAPGADA